jgi:hemerythrin
MSNMQMFSLEFFYLKERSIESNKFPASDAEALINALRVHFETEERLADGASFCFSDHAAGHHEMLNRVVAATNSVRDGKMNVFNLIRYLDYWFERHIYQEDIALGNRLNETPDLIIAPRDV